VTFPSPNEGENCKLVARMLPRAREWTLSRQLINFGHLVDRRIARISSGVGPGQHGAAAPRIFDAPATEQVNAKCRSAHSGNSAAEHPSPPTIAALTRFHLGELGDQIHLPPSRYVSTARRCAKMRGTQFTARPLPRSDRPLGIAKRLVLPMQKSLLARIRPAQDVARRHGAHAGCSAIDYPASAADAQGAAQRQATC